VYEKPPGGQPGDLRPTGTNGPAAAPERSTRKLAAPPRNDDHSRRHACRPRPPPSRARTSTDVGSRLSETMPPASPRPICVLNSPARVHPGPAQRPGHSPIPFEFGAPGGWRVPVWYPARRGSNSHCPPMAVKAPPADITVAPTAHRQGPDQARVRGSGIHKAVRPRWRRSARAIRLRVWPAMRVNSPSRVRIVFPATARAWTEPFAFGFQDVAPPAAASSAAMRGARLTADVGKLACRVEPCPPFTASGRGRSSPHFGPRACASRGGVPARRCGCGSGPDRWP